MSKTRYKPIEEYSQKWISLLNAYVILNGRGEYIAKILSIHKNFYKSPGRVQIDVYSRNELIHQFVGNHEDYPYANALNRIKLDEVMLFSAGTPIVSDAVAIADREKDFYLPGLDRLKALGYKIIKVI